MEAHHNFLSIQLTKLFVRRLTLECSYSSTRGSKDSDDLEDFPGPTGASGDAAEAQEGGHVRGV